MKIELSIIPCRSTRVLLRQLMMLSYFSPLLDQAEAVAGEQSMAANYHTNMLYFAPPLEIPWSDVAVHVMNSHVSSC